MQVRRGSNCEFSKHLEPRKLVWEIPIALPKHQSKAQEPSNFPLSGSIEIETRQDKTMGCNTSIHTRGAEFSSKSEANTGLIVNSIAEIVCFSNLLFEGSPPTTKFLMEEILLEAEMLQQHLVLNIG